MLRLISPTLIHIIYQSSPFLPITQLSNNERPISHHRPHSFNYLFNFSIQDIFRTVNLYPQDKQTYQLEYRVYVQLILSLALHFLVKNLFYEVTQINSCFLIPFGENMSFIYNTDRFFCHSRHFILVSSNLLIDF